MSFGVIPRYYRRGRSSVGWASSHEENPGHHRDQENHKDEEGGYRAEGDDYAVGGLGDARYEEDQEDDGAEKEAARLACPPETLLRRGQNLPLFRERLVDVPRASPIRSLCSLPRAKSCFPALRRSIAASGCFPPETVRAPDRLPWGVL